MTAHIQSSLLVIGCGIVAHFYASQSQSFFPVKKEHARHLVFAVGCMLIAQYFVF